MFNFLMLALLSYLDIKIIMLNAGDDKYTNKIKDLGI
jgi:hypothetical protein